MVWIGWPWLRQKELKCFVNECDTHKIKRDTDWELAANATISQAMALDLTRLIFVAIKTAESGTALRNLLLGPQARMRQYKMSPTLFEPVVNSAFLVGLNMEFPS